MRQELASLDRERAATPTARLVRIARAGATAAGKLSAIIDSIRRSPKSPAIIVVLIGAALCGVVSGSIKAADARAKRFAAFIAGEVQKDAAARNIKVLTVGSPGSFDVTSRPPVRRRSTGRLVEADGARTSYQVESVQVCPEQEPACWRVTRVTYGDPS